MVMANKRTIIGFDTLAAAHALEEAGVERREAEAHANVIAGAVAGGGPVTRAEFAEFETRLTVRLYGGFAALGALVAALITALDLLS